MLYSAIFSSPLGPIWAVADEKNLIGLWIEGQTHGIADLSEAPIKNSPSEILCRTRDWLDRYFAGECPSPCELPLAPQGSDFRKAVWQCLLEIPYGETTTYGAIAKRIAHMQDKATMSAQAVGGAVGHNPISIIIPCHRVIGTDGSLTGYDGGLDIKRYLLKHEGISIPQA